MTSMRRRYVASTSVRCHVHAGTPLAPQYFKPWPPNILILPMPIVSQSLRESKLLRISTNKDYDESKMRTRQKQRIATFGNPGDGKKGGGDGEVIKEQH